MTAGVTDTRVHYGDASSEELMRRVGVDRARFLAVTLPDTVLERALIARARQMNPNLFILARSRRGTEDEQFYLDGADEVIHETFEAGIEFIARILRRLNFPKQEVERQIGEARSHRYEILRREDFAPRALSGRTPHARLAAGRVPGDPCRVTARRQGAARRGNPRTDRSARPGRGA